VNTFYYFDFVKFGMNMSNPYIFDFLLLQKYKKIWHFGKLKCKFLVLWHTLMDLIFPFFALIITARDISIESIMIL